MLLLPASVAFRSVPKSFDHVAVLNSQQLLAEVPLASHGFEGVKVEGCRIYTMQRDGPSCPRARFAHHVLPCCHRLMCTGWGTAVPFRCIPCTQGGPYGQEVGRYNIAGGDRPAAACRALSKDGWVCRAPVSCRIIPSAIKRVRLTAKIFFVFVMTFFTQNL